MREHASVTLTVAPATPVRMLTESEGYHNRGYPSPDTRARPESPGAGRRRRSPRALAQEAGDSSVNTRAHQLLQTAAPTPARLTEALTLM